MAVSSAVNDGGIKMSGRVVFVLRALERDKASALTGAHEAGKDGGGAGQPAKFDRRHTYLAYEGEEGWY